MKCPSKTLKNLPYQQRSFFFRFSFHITLSFPLMNALVYIDKKPGHSLGGKNKVARNENRIIFS